MKLTIDLTPDEEAAIRGWVNYYAAHSAYIGVPPPAVKPPGAPTWQTRIVLDSCTHERYNEIAAQCLGPIAPSLPYDIIDSYAPGKYPSERQVFQASADRIVAIPFQMPVGPFPVTNHWYGSSSEYGGAPVPRRATVSRTPGDMIGIARSAGANVTIDLWVDASGGQYYWNIWQDPGTTPQQTSFTVGGWPH